MCDPHERTAIDDRKARKLATVMRKTLEHRLANVGQARGYVESLAEHCEAHREPVEARLAILLGPAQVDQRCEQPMRATFRKIQLFGNVAKRHLTRAVGKQLDDSQATLRRYMSHVAFILD